MPASIPAGTLDKFTTFGDLLRFLRRRAGITQMELSIAVGYSDAQISRLEQNLRLPDIPTIEARFVPALYLEEESRAVSRLIDLAASVRREDAPALGLCPYKGLSYFEEIDADLFVGREKLTNKLVERVLSNAARGESGYHRFIAIVGASGSGKSSLARAGLVPALHWDKTSSTWPIYLFTPTAHPLQSLASSLTQDLPTLTSTAALMDDLARESRSLDLFLSRSLDPAGADHVLLVVDQFEELFALCRSEAERAAFVDNLLVAASKPDGAVIVAITLRADFYAACAAYPRLREALTHQQEYIGAMRSDELRRAIEEPAQRGRWEFEPGLVDLLLHDIGREPGALPLLSHALLETWQRRRGRTLTISGYISSGGVRGAIAETAEAVFSDQFTPEQRTIARRIFLRLTELGDENTTRDTRRRVAYSELILKPDKANATQTVLKALADARLIITSENTVEVAHEALIREWPTLHNWIEENREDLRFHSHLTETAQEWLASNLEPDSLYRGLRLEQAREWARTHAEEMNALEREFLAASSDLSERETTEREAQRQRELDAARRLADSERQRAEEQSQYAGQLKKRAYFLAGALVISFAMAFIALFFSSQARHAAVTAQNERRIGFSRELSAEAINNLNADPELSILLAMQAITETYSTDNTWTIDSENALRLALDASRVQLTLRGHSGQVLDSDFTPDGRRLATLSDDGTAKVWDAETGKNLLTIPAGNTHGLATLAFSPDGKRLVTSSSLGTAKVWDASTGQELLTLGDHTDWVTGVAFSPDGSRIATGSEDRTIKVWDASTGQEQLSLIGHTGQVLGVAFSPDGKQIASTSSDRSAKVWDSITGELQLSLPEQEITAFVAFSPDGTSLATGSFDMTAKIWDISTGELRLTLRGHTHAVVGLDFNPDGTRLATASLDGKAIVWDTSTGQELFRLTGHRRGVFDVSFSPDCVRSPGALPEECGTRLATASGDGTVRVWNASFSRELLTLNNSNVSARAFSPNGKTLACGTADGRVIIYDLSSLQQEALLGQDTFPTMSGERLSWSAHSQTIVGMAISADSTRLATTSQDKTTKIWDLSTGNELLTLSGPASGIYSIIFSPDGKHLVTTSPNYTVIVWDLANGAKVFSQTLPSWSFAIAVSPDGTQLAAGSNDGTVHIWDLPSTKEKQVLRGHTGEIWSVAFSPDGTQLASASEDGTGKVWDTATGQVLLTLQGHTSAVNGIRFSPDGLRLATAGQDGTARIWDARTGRELHTLFGHKDPLGYIAFAQDGDWLLTTSYDGLVRFYILGIEDLMALARRRVTRAITGEECQQYLHLSEQQCSQGVVQSTEAPALSVSQSLGDATPAKGRVCEVTDRTGVNDQFFNQIAYQGVKESAEQFGWEGLVLETLQKTEYQNITEFVQSKCDLIVVPMGPYYSDLIQVAAEANPNQKFQIMEANYNTKLANLWTQYYVTDQAAFLAGYLAASVTRSGKVATYGGVEIPSVTNFMDGFALGVKYYNEKNGTQIEVLGWDVQAQDGLFTGNFVDTNDGFKIGERLMDAGADIILPVAGYVGLGTAAAAKDRGDTYLIGVDSDWVITYPEYADIILTSIEKNLDASVLSAVKTIVNGTFTGGVHLGTLENGGVGLAPFHNLDSLVSPKIKADLEQVKADIISGKIETTP